MLDNRRSATWVKFGIVGLAAIAVGFVGMTYVRAPETFGVATMTGSTPPTVGLGPKPFDPSGINARLGVLEKQVSSISELREQLKELDERTSKVEDDQLRMVSSVARLGDLAVDMKKDLTRQDARLREVENSMSLGADGN